MEHNNRTDAQLYMLDLLGLYRPRQGQESNRQGSLAERSQHGMPVKGSKAGRPDKRKQGIAAVAATGEAVLVRRGPLMHACANIGRKGIVKHHSMPFSLRVAHGIFSPPCSDTIKPRAAMDEVHYHLKRAIKCRAKAHVYRRHGRLGMFHSWMRNAMDAIKDVLILRPERKRNVVSLQGLQDTINTAMYNMQIADMLLWKACDNWFKAWQALEPLESNGVPTTNDEAALDCWYDMKEAKRIAYEEWQDASDTLEAAQAAWLRTRNNHNS